MNINPGDSMEIYTEGGTIVLKKYAPGCVLCGEVNGLLNVDGVKMCRECGEKIAEAMK